MQDDSNTKQQSCTLNTTLGERQQKSLLLFISGRDKRVPVRELRRGKWRALVNTAMNIHVL